MPWSSSIITTMKTVNYRSTKQQLYTDPGSYKFTIRSKRKRNERITRTKRKRTENERTIHANETNEKRKR